MTRTQSHVRFRADSSLDLRGLRQSRIQSQLGCADAFEGVITDPASLHKYLYANANPINGTDPSGHMTLKETLTVAGVLTILTTILGGLTTASVGYHIGQDEDLRPDAFAVNIGVAGAYRGATLGGVFTVMKDFKTGQWSYFVTGEGGLAPVSYFKNHRGIAPLLTFGFIWNMDDPAQMSGWGTTATWPRVFSRFAVPATISASPWARILTNLARYSLGANVKDRQGVVQLSQSTSGPAEIAAGWWSYSFGWTVGYSSTPRPLSGLPGHVRSLFDRMSGLIGSISTEMPAETTEAQLASALNAGLGFEDWVGAQED